MVPFDLLLGYFELDEAVLAIVRHENDGCNSTDAVMLNAT